MTQAKVGRGSGIKIIIFLWINLLAYESLWYLSTNYGDGKLY